MTHVIQRISILGTGLIGGSFALALRKYATDLHITGWDRPDVARTAQETKAFDEMLTGDLTPAIGRSDLRCAADWGDDRFVAGTRSACAEKSVDYGRLQHEAADQSRSAGTFCRSGCAAVFAGASDGGS
jgi:prephenate dehydrogenase